MYAFALSSQKQYFTTGNLILGGLNILFLFYLLGLTGLDLGLLPVSENSWFLFTDAINYFHRGLVVVRLRAGALLFLVSRALNIKG